jgi:hypothetical protein
MQITTKYSARVASMTAGELERALVNDPATSYALVETLGAACGRDPINALRDAELALAVARKRVDEVLGAAL